MSTLEIDAAGLGAFNIPQLFARDLKPLHPSLNDDLLDLFGHAERVLSNQFDFLQGSDSSDMKFVGPPDSSAPAALHSFDYALDLALAYHISREEKYSRHLHYLVADWIAHNPPGQGPGWFVPLLALRIRNWILAADLVREDWSSDPEFLDVFGQSLTLQSAYLLNHAACPCSSPDALEVCRALLLASRSFNKGGTHSIQAAWIRILLECLQDQVLPDGGSVASQPGPQFHLTSALMDIVILQSGLIDTELAFVRNKLKETILFLEGTLLPDGSLPAFGIPESSTEGLADLFALAAVYFEAPSWKRLAGKFGILPYLLMGEAGKERFDKLPDEAWKPGDSFFPLSGFYRLTGAQGSGLVINGATPKSPINHDDFLSYELMIEGQRAIVDSGAYGPTERPENDTFRQARAHNVLLVDGQGSQNSGLKSTDAKKRRPRADVKGLQIENSGFRFLGIQHERAWFCLEGRAWVILDRLEGAGTHRVTNLVHLYPTFKAEISLDGVVARSRYLAFTIFYLGSPRSNIHITCGPDTCFPGWYAPDLGVKYASTVVRMESEGVLLPWVGGYLIVSGQDPKFSAAEIDPVAGTVRIELAEIGYSLSLDGRADEKTADI